MPAQPLELDPSAEVNPALASRLGRPRTVLDLGCGAGTNGMLARSAGARVVGVEANPELAERARQVLDEVIQLDPLDTEALLRALGERRFDLVLVPTSLERVAEPGRLLKQAASFLEPEGRLLCALRNPEAWSRKLGLSDERFGFGAIAGDSPHLHELDEARGWAAAAELELLEVAWTPLLARALRPAAALSPSLFAYQYVLVMRRRIRARRLSLTVGMLTMDEEPSVGRMIEEIRRYAADAQILCVDSSVKDRTPIIAEQLGARVLRQLPPRGHGPAMELLMYEAANQSDALIYLDCDFTYPAENIVKIREILESGADLVNAARTRTRPQAMPLANYVANKAFVWCARALNGVPISDLHSGMRGYRSSVIRSFAFDGSGDALPIDTLLWPARSGYRVVEIPIEYQERVGASKLRKLTGTAWTFVRLARTLTVGSRPSGSYERWGDG
ncbi:MAG: methyltransferase domain-containing protein [Myxococcota bacterium]